MIVLLSGATSGIGLETLKELVNKQIKVYALGRNFDNIRSYFKGGNDYIVPIYIDLGHISEIENIFKVIEQNKDKLDAFINCAGYEETIPLRQYEKDLIEKIFVINILATIELVRLFSLKKYSNDGASIVLLSSVMGSLGQPGKIGYCSSKSAIGGLVKSSALELAKRKIRVNSISPGIVNTEMTKKLFEKVGESSKENIIEEHPLGIGETEDIIPAILFLISDGARWITGVDLIIDGGYSAK